MNAELPRFRRKRMAMLAACCVVIGLPLVLASHRGALVFEFGAMVIGCGAGLFTVALLLPVLNRLPW